MVNDRGNTGNREQLTPEYYRERGGIVVQTYPNSQDAEAAVNSLLNVGFTSDDFSIVAKDGERAQQVAEDTGADTAEGIGIGALSGGVLGGIAGLLSGAAVFAIPGAGWVLAGPVAVVVGGAASGAVGGGIVGALTALGIDEDEAEQYQQRVEAGDLLVVVAAGDREPVARDILQHAHAHG